MNKSRFLKRLYLLAFLMMLTSVSVISQVFDANFQPVNFGGTGVTITNKVGTGTAVNDKVLYQNVITIGTQQIDAIVTTMALNNVSTFSAFDQTGTGTGYTNNLPQWFSPQFNFGTGGGSAQFKFQFILGGSYNNTTNTGTNVTLQNVKANTYDIDGNGTSGTNQFNEFGGFITYELGNPTNLAATYNSSLNLTKFRSGSSVNTTDPNDVKNRVRVTYSSMSNFTISVGAEGSGFAYYFLDFSVGPAFSTAVLTSAPNLDLNTNTTGVNNSNVFSGNNTVRFAEGATNITSSGTTLDDIKLSFTTSMLQNAASELLVFNGSSAGGSIPLNFANGASITNLTVGGVTYAITANVAGGVSTLSFAKSGGGTITLAQAEAFVDAMRYQNSATTPTSGTRTFNVTIRDGSLSSPAAQYTTQLYIHSCPSVDSRNNGNGQASQCAGVGSNAMAPGFQYTTYATVPTAAKTGDIIFRWATLPSIIPAITKVWIDGSLSLAQVGPASPSTISGTNYLIKYCFYNVNLPPAGVYTLEFTDPSTGAILGRCTYTGNTNVVTTEPTLSNGGPLSVNTVSITNTNCSASSNGSATVQGVDGVPPYRYSWSPSGGTAATASGLAAGTYYCTVTDTANTSVIDTIVIGFDNVTPTISGTTQSSVCGSGTITLGAAASAGTINWYAAATVGTSLGSGTSFTTPSISSTTTYYVDATANGCTTAIRTAVVATVNAIPTMSGTTPSAVCGSGTVTLGAAASAGTINWYAASTGGTSLGTGTSYTTPSISSTTTYYVDATANGCTTASRTAVVATVNTIPVPTINVIGDTLLCAKDSTMLSSLNNLSTSGGAIQFNGSNNYVQEDSTLVLNVTQGFTIEGWMKINNLNKFNALATQTVGNNPAPFDIYTSNDGTGRISFLVGAGSVTGAITTTASITANTWSHVACVYNNVAGQIYIYINGVLSATGTATLPGNSASSVFRIGNRQDNYTFTSGMLDEIRIWNSVRTQAQILANMSAGVPNNSPTLKAYYQFNEGTGIRTANSVTGLNSALLINSPTWITSGAAPSYGPYASYLWSNGSTTSNIAVRTTGNYSVTVTDNNGCIGSSASSKSITADTTIVGNTITGVQSICSGSIPTTLNGATPTGGNRTSYTYAWLKSTTSANAGFTVANGTANAKDYVSAALTQTTWFKRVVSSGLCGADTSAAIQVTVNTIPSISSTTDNNRCGTGTVTLGAAASAGTINWYAASTGGTSLGSGTSFTTPSISTTTTYYVDATATGCTTASRTAVIATVNAIPTISGTTPSSVCGSGTVTLGASASAGTINWYAASTGGTSLGSGTSFTTPSISTTTTYYVDATANGCTTASRTAVVATVNAVPTISGTTPGSVCGSGTVTLGASASAGTINWYAASTGGTSLSTGTSYTTPSISTTTTYYVDATSNGCTTASRTAVVATVNAIPTISGTTPSSVCGSGTVTLGAAASAGTVNWYAASTGGTSLGTGTSFTTPSISSTTTYYVDATANSCTTTSRTAVIATVNAIPSISGTTPSSVCGSGTVTLGAAASAGTINWYAASTGGTSLSTGTSYTTPSISSTTTYYADATANGCTTASRTAVIATVNPIITASVSISASTTSVCGSNPITFTATPINGGTTPTYQWKLNGVNVGTNSSTYVLSSPVANDSVNVVMTSNATPCLATASVNGNGLKLTNATISPSVSISANPGNTVCAGTNVTFTATPINGGSSPVYQWKNKGVNIGTNSNSYSSAGLTTNDSIYVILTSNATCLSTTTANSNALVMTVNAIPSISSTTDNNRCGTGTVTLGATASAGTINWYAASTGGTSLATGTSYTTPSISATTTYYVDVTANGCTTATRSAVIATINAIPSISSTTDNNRCGTGTIILGATASAGTINWYAASTGGTSLGTGTSFTTPSISSTTTYYVDATANSCTTTSRTAVIATVNTIPSISSTTDNNRCGTGTVTLGATASAGTINWYAASTGGTSLATGTSYTTPSISATTTYYVDVTANGCTTATRSAVIATINAIPSISSTTDNNRCGTGTIILGATASAGTINWYAASTGGTSLATGTSYTTPSISTTTTYYVDATANGCTTASRTAVVATVNAIPSISGTTPSSVCGSGTVTLGAAASAGTINWYASSTGGTSLGSGTSFTTPSISTTTTYYVDATANGCTTASRTAVVATVNAVPTISGTTPGSVCGSGTVTLGASASAGTINWYAASTGGTSLSTGTSYTTPSISSTTTYYVDATANGCTTASRTAVVATVNAIPTVSGTTPGSVCGTGTVTLGATASAGTINWYAAATGGTSLATGTSYTTPSISSTTTYYVDATANGCTTASRTALVATVNAIPTVSGTTPAARCSTGTVTLGATASVGIVNWYSAASGGTSLGTGTSYTTPSISGTTTYYVDATNIGCTTVNRTAVIATVNPNITASVSVSASTTSVCGSSPITFTATPTNGGTIPAYQWKLNGVNVGTNSSTYVLSSPVANDSVNVVMTSNATPCLVNAQSTGNGVKLTNSTVNPVVTITSNTGNAICAGGNIVFTATPNNGGSSPTYQWYRNGVNVGTNSATYSTTSLNNKDTIKVLLTSNASCLSTSTAMSNALVITVNTTPSITTQPVLQRIVSGNTVQFSVLANNVVSYQWQTAPQTGAFINVPNGSVYTGGNTATLFVSNTNGLNNQRYRVVLTNVCGNTNSDSVTLFINAKPDALNDTLFVAQGKQDSVVVLNNDSDADGILSNPTIVSAPLHGTSTVTLSGKITYQPTAGYYGYDTLSYRVCDNGNPVACDTAFVFIKINAAPIVSNDTISINEDDSVIINVRLNDNDPDGPLNNPVIRTQPNNGTVTINPNGTITFKPNPNFYGLDSFMYRVCDNGMPVLCDSAWVRLNINPVNDAPNAINDTAYTGENTPVVINVRNNDTDIDGTLSNPTIINQPKNGTVTVNANGTITYTPNVSYNGVDSFMYRVCDNGMPILCDSAWVGLNINSINDGPDAVDDTLTCNEDDSITVDLRLNDSDVDGILNNPVIRTQPNNGTVVVNTNGTITFIPNPNYHGIDSFMYRVCDNGMPVLCDSAWVRLNINPINDGPDALDDTTSVNEDDSVTINVRLNDSDVDGSLNNPIIRNNPTNGSVVVNADGTIKYIPNPNYHGLDSFMYRVCDNGMPVLCDSAWVRLNILDVNDGPDALDDTLTFNEDDSITVDLRLNDNDVDGTLNNPVIIANPANGSVVVNADGTIKYIPNPNYHGLDSFMYRVCDNGMPALCDSAWVRLNINPINDAPNAVNDSVHTSEHLPIVINVRNNDTDVDGVLNNPVALTQPANGTLTINANGTITFTPVPFYHGIDSFMYRVCDNGLPILCDSAWVIIRIDSLNDAPDAVDDSLTVSEDDSITVDLRLNDTDVDGTLNNPVIITNPANGSVLVNADGTVKYIPNPNYHGLDSFMYRVCDDGTPALCDSAWVRLNILDVNDGPDAIDDILTLSEDDSVTVDLRLNDTDLDGTLNNPTIITNPAHGSVVVNADGTVKYIPNPNYHGLDSFMYRVCDNGMPVLCDSALVRINVLDVNDKPAAINDTASTNQNVAIVISVLTNDIDTDGTLNNPTVVTQPLNGTVVVNANGTLAYTPNTNYFGVDSFMYKVCDNGTPVLCDSAWVNITIKNVISNLAPIAVDDTIQVSENDKVVFNVTTNDYDQDGNKLGLPVVIKAPLHGTLLLRADTTFIYIPATGYIGNDQFTYTIADNGIPSKLDTAVVYIEVVALVVKVPDGFSPDGDGTNDKFVIPGIEKYPNNKLTIVNRWGDVVYEKSQYQNDWGGEPNKGILLDKGVLPAGNYFYIFETGTTDKSITGSLYINK